MLFGNSSRTGFLLLEAEKDNNYYGATALHKVSVLLVFLAGMYLQVLKVMIPNFCAQNHFPMGAQKFELTGF